MGQRGKYSDEGCITPSTFVPFSPDDSHFLDNVRYITDIIMVAPSQKLEDIPYIEKVIDIYNITGVLTFTKNYLEYKCQPFIDNHLLESIEFRITIDPLNNETPIGGLIEASNHLVDTARKFVGKLLLVDDLLVHPCAIIYYLTLRRFQYSRDLAWIMTRYKTRYLDGRRELFFRQTLKTLKLW